MYHILQIKAAHGLEVEVLLELLVDAVVVEKGEGGDGGDDEVVLEAGVEGEGLDVALLSGFPERGEFVVCRRPARPEGEGGGGGGSSLPSRPSPDPSIGS